MKLLAVFLFMFSHVVHAGDIIFLDMTGSDKEVATCRAAVAEHNKKTGSTDKVWTVDGRMDEPHLKAAVEYIEAQGRTISNLALSGHNVSDEVWGVEGHLSAEELQDLVAQNPKLQNSLQMISLFGCYTSTYTASKSYWLKNTGPNVNTTIGYTLQSPNALTKGDTDVIGDVCGRQSDFIDANNEAVLNQTFNEMPGIQDWQIGICNRKGICSAEYADVGGKNGSCFRTYDQIAGACKDHDPSKAKIAVTETVNGKKRTVEKNLADEYKNFFNATLPGYDNPPCDEQGDVSDASVCPSAGQKSILRLYYDQVQLWQQCADDFGGKDLSPGYVMPDIDQMVRLIKFPEFRENFARVQKDNIAEFSAKLAAIGDPQQDSLQDLNSLSRKMIMLRTRHSVDWLTSLALKHKQGELINGVDPRKLLVMAKGFQLSLGQLDPSCTDVSLIHTNSNDSATCVSAYGDIP